MQSRIEGFARLEDAEGDMDELAHHCAENEHGRLACCGQPIPEGAPPHGSRRSHHGGHVQRAAQRRMAHLRQSRLAPHAAARLVLARIQTGEGNRLTGLIEPRFPAVVRQQNRDGFIAQAGDCRATRAVP